MTTAIAFPPPTPIGVANKSKIQVKAKACQGVNPCNGKTLKTLGQLTTAQLAMPLKTAATCFESWRLTTFAERAILVARAVNLMWKRAESFPNR